MTLEVFIQALKDVDVKDDAAFARLVREGMSLLNVLDKDLAREFSASRPTITRWRNGSNAPHPALRKPVYNWLAERARAVLKSRAQLEKASAKASRAGAPSCEPAQAH